LRYEVVKKLEDYVYAYIEDVARACAYLAKISPKARVRVTGDAVVFKYTAVGRKYRHHIYVEYRSIPERQMAVIRVKPKYPAYLFPVLAPHMVIAYPAGIFPLEDEVRAIVVPEFEQAVEVLKQAYTKYTLLDPSRFTEDEEVGFEGYLYRTPVGLVSFLQERGSFELVDIIESHVEDEEEGEDIVHPVDFFKNVMDEAFKKWVESSGK